MNQRGMGALMVVFLAAALMGAVAIGWRVYEARQAFDAIDQSADIQAEEIPAAPQINDSDDLDTALRTLDSVNFDLAEAEASQLESDASSE